MDGYTCGVCGKTIPDYDAWVSHGCEGKARRGGASTVISDEFIPLPGGGTGTRKERDKQMADRGLASKGDYSDAFIARQRAKREANAGFSRSEKQRVYDKLVGNIPAGVV